MLQNLSSAAVVISALRFKVLIRPAILRLINMFYTTVLPANSDSDVMFCSKSYHGQYLSSIDQLCINPIYRVDKQ